MGLKSVQVVMSTFNGEKYLNEQIDSILSQKNVDVKLYIRDDGSSDGSRKSILNYAENQNVNYKFGENQGFVKSFLDALDSCGEADYYAFSDQDDVWQDDKLITAVSMLEKENPEIPLLYCSALQRVDENLNFISIQQFPGLLVSLPSMLARGRLAGCTFVFNNRLRELVKGGSKISIHSSHDSWVLLVCLSCNGKVIFDKTSHILFRRHGTNTSIDGGSFKNRLRYEFRYFKNYKDNRRDTSEELLRYIGTNISEDSRRFLEKVVNYKMNMITRIKFAMCREINCGIPMANLINRVTILFGNF